MKRGAWWWLVVVGILMGLYAIKMLLPPVFGLINGLLSALLHFKIQMPKMISISYTILISTAMIVPLLAAFLAAIFEVIGVPAGETPVGSVGAVAPLPRGHERPVGAYEEHEDRGDGNMREALLDPREELAFVRHPRARDDVLRPIL